ncbi:hypothetical protein AB7W64_16230 [Proteus mirabilis]
MGRSIHDVKIHHHQYLQSKPLFYQGTNHSYPCQVQCEQQLN